MKICDKCHGLIVCGETHTLVNTHGIPQSCGFCGSRAIDYECQSPAAIEIGEFNRAADRFLLRMRVKFIENMAKGKGGWRTIDWAYTVKRLMHEMGEFTERCMTFVKSDACLDAIVSEAADLANFALFAATRAMDESAVDRAIRERADAAWVEMRKKNGECCNPVGPCDTPGIPVGTYCEVCKARFAKKDTERREVRA